MGNIIIKGNYNVAINYVVTKRSDVAEVAHTETNTITHILNFDNEIYNDPKSELMLLMVLINRSLDHMEMCTWEDKDPEKFIKISGQVVVTDNNGVAHPFDIKSVADFRNFVRTANRLVHGKEVLDSVPPVKQHDKVDFILGEVKFSGLCQATGFRQTITVAQTVKVGDAKTCYAPDVTAQDLAIARDLLDRAARLACDSKYLARYHTLAGGFVGYLQLIPTTYSMGVGSEVIAVELKSLEKLLNLAGFADSLIPKTPNLDNEVTATSPLLQFTRTPEVQKIDREEKILSPGSEQHDEHETESALARCYSALRNCLS